MNSHDSEEFKPALRFMPMPRDTNVYGTIFGGVILSWIDQAGFVEARRHAKCRWVTASIERVDFRSPVNVGDLVRLLTRPRRTGTGEAEGTTGTGGGRRPKGTAGAGAGESATQPAQAPPGLRPSGPAKGFRPRQPPRLTPLKRA